MEDGHRREQRSLSPTTWDGGRRRAGIGISLLPNPKPESPQRGYIRVAQVGSSTYLHIGGPPRERANATCEKFRTALDLAANHGAPWVIGADFNAEPAELMEAAAATLRRAGAVIMAPTTPTHYPAEGRARVLDYFIVDERIAKSVTKVGVAHDIVTTSHRAAQVGHRVVYLEFDGTAMGSNARMMRKPRSMPREVPIGCARSPVLPRRDYVDMMKRATGDDDQMSILSMWWRDLAGCLEAEVARRYDLVDEQGLPPQAYTGRGNGFQTVWRPVLPARADGKDGGGDQITHCLIWLATRLGEKEFGQ